MTEPTKELLPRPVQLQIRHTYKARNGKIYTIDSYTTHFAYSNYPYMGTGGMCWNAEGIYKEPGVPSEFDLLEDVTESVRNAYLGMVY